MNRALLVFGLAVVLLTIPEWHADESMPMRTFRTILVAFFFGMLHIGLKRPHS